LARWIPTRRSEYAADFNAEIVRGRGSNPSCVGRAKAADDLPDGILFVSRSKDVLLFAGRSWQPFHSSREEAIQ
jgi:hypothetical protein